MITKLLMAWCLVAVCVAVHAGGLAAALRWLSRAELSSSQQFWPATRLFVRLAVWIILLHLTEIVSWAILYFAWNAMPDAHSSCYFSAVTYTTTGYGDLVLPKEWRLVGGIESLTGVLMCGWSTGFFFAVVSRMYQRSPELPN